MTAALAIVRSWMPPEDGRQGMIVRQSTDAEIIQRMREDAAWWADRVSSIYADRVRCAIRFRSLMFRRNPDERHRRSLVWGFAGPTGQVIVLPWRGADA